MVALVFIVEMAFGLVLVHWPNGWLVVGHGTNGIDCSVVPIAALAAVALMVPASGGE